MSRAGNIVHRAATEGFSEEKIGIVAGVLQPPPGGTFYTEGAECK